MIYFQIDYNWYWVPDSHGPELLQVLSRIRKADSEGYGTKRALTPSNEMVKVSIFTASDVEVSAALIEQPTFSVPAGAPDDEVPF